MADIRRIITVAEEDMEALKKAVTWAGTMISSGALMKVGGDIYDYVKSHLSENGVQHKDEHIDPKNIPSQRVYWHK